MEVESPCFGVGRCLYLAKADLILKPETNVIVCKWGHYWDQHAISILFKNGVSNIILANRVLHYSVIGSQMVRK